MQYTSIRNILIIFSGKKSNHQKSQEKSIFTKLTFAKKKRNTMRVLVKKLGKTLEVL